MLAFTIAHLSICVLRYREPDRPRPYRIPGGIRWRGGVLPVPAVLGTVLSGAALDHRVVLHAGARYVGLSWLPSASRSTSSTENARASRCGRA